MFGYGKVLGNKGAVKTRNLISESIKKNEARWYEIGLIT